jgi:PIN domain nuclease of toxin-antitoxin system
VVVLDTGALVYWSLDPERLSVPAAAAIAAVEQKVVSSISIWEIGQKIKRGELSLPLRLSDYDCTGR